MLAEQQQFADSLLKGDKSSKDKKPKKHPVKKNKAKAVPFEEKLHVEFEPDAEVIPEEPLPPKKSEKKEKVSTLSLYSTNLLLIFIKFAGQTDIA